MAITTNIASCNESNRTFALAGLLSMVEADILTEEGLLHQMIRRRDAAREIANSIRLPMVNEVGVPVTAAVRNRAAMIADTYQKMISNFAVLTDDWNDPTLRSSTGHT
jgi:hypothetical protein